jgi:hypothetical protein
LTVLCGQTSHRHHTLWLKHQPTAFILLITKFAEVVELYIITEFSVTGGKTYVILNIAVNSNAISRPTTLPIPYDVYVFRIKHTKL